MRFSIKRHNLLKYIIAEVQSKQTVDNVPLINFMFIQEAKKAIHDGTAFYLLLYKIHCFTTGLPLHCRYKPASGTTPCSREGSRHWYFQELTSRGCKVHPTV